MAKPPAASSKTSPSPGAPSAANSPASGDATQGGGEQTDPAAGAAGTGAETQTNQPDSSAAQGGEGGEVGGANGGAPEPEPQPGAPSAGDDDQGEQQPEPQPTPVRPPSISQMLQNALQSKGISDADASDLAQIQFKFIELKGSIARVTLRTAPEIDAVLNQIAAQI